MKLTAQHIRELHTGAIFLACAADPEWCGEQTERTLAHMRSHQENAMLVGVDELHDDDLVVTIGYVNSGLPLSELRPCGDEFVSSVRLIEQAVGQPVKGLIPLAGANINGIVPALAAMQLEIPVVDADPMGRVFPLVEQTVFALDGLPVGMIATTGATGESALVQVNRPRRAERLIRALATEFGGWSATALFPMSAKAIREHAILGSVSRMIRIGALLGSQQSVAEKQRALSSTEGVFKVIRARVSDVRGMSRPARPGQPGRPSSVVLIDEDQGRIVQIEIQNELLMVLIDGVVAAVLPDIITLLHPTLGTVASLDDLWVGNSLDIVMLRGNERWYQPDGLQLVGQVGQNVLMRGRR